MPLAQVKVGQIVKRGPTWTVPGQFRRWAPGAGRVVRPQPVQPVSDYRRAPGYLWAREKVLTARPFAYRAAMDRPFPDPGLRVTEATEQMLPAVHPWGRYTVPHPGRGRVRAFRFPDRPTLSEATGYYTATEEALGLGDPGLAGFKFKKLVRKVSKVTGTVLRVAAPALSFIPGIGIPLAAAASITGQMLSSRKPLTVFRKPLRVFGEAALAAATGPALKGASTLVKVGTTGVGMLQKGMATFAPTGNVPTAEVLREAGVPPPAPAIGWGEVAQTVGTVLTAGADITSQLLRRQQPAETSAGWPQPQVLDGGWGTPTQGAYVPGSVGSPGAPAEAGPVMAPEMVQQAGMFGGPMMMPLLIVGGVVALLAATR